MVVLGSSRDDWVEFAPKRPPGVALGIDVYGAWFVCHHWKASADSGADGPHG